MYSVPLSRGEVDRDLIDLIMLCKEFDVSDIESVKRIYRSSYINLYRTSRYTTATLSVLALHIYMSNNNMVSPLREYCKFMGVRSKTVKTLLDRLAPTEIYRPAEWKPLLKNLGYTKNERSEIESLVELVEEKIDINMNILSACVYRATNLSLRKVARAFYISRQTVLKYSEKLEEIL